METNTSHSDVKNRKSMDYMSLCDEADKIFGLYRELNRGPFTPESKTFKGT